MVAFSVLARRLASMVAGRSLAAALVPGTCLVSCSASFSTKSSTPSPAENLPLCFVSEFTYFPLAGKKDPRGEDASFMSKYAVGVADGVGGWSEVGVDSGLYSRSLMEHAKEYCLDAALDADIDAGVDIDPMSAAAHAHSLTRVQGSTTFVIATIGRAGKLKLLNLGDSGAMVWRHTKPLHVPALAKLPIEEAAKLWTMELRTKEQTMAFNTPYQVDASEPLYKLAELYEVQPVPGDIVILATDGMYDNLFIEDIRRILAKHDMTAVRAYVRQVRQRVGELRAEKGKLENIRVNSVKEVAVTDGELQDSEKQARAVLKSITAALAMEAVKVGKDEKAVSPFSKAAPPRYRYTGGKPDDTMVMACLVVPDQMP